jgi:DNA-binding protein YbaB
MTAMRQEIDAVRVTETGPRNVVTITIDARGVPVDVRFSDRSRELSGSALGKEFMTALRRAQSAIADRVTEAAQSTVAGVDPGTAHRVISRYRERFPRVSAESGSPPPPPTEDDGDFSDQTFLR